MPKSRKRKVSNYAGRQEVRRMKRAEAFHAAAKVKVMVEQFTHQSQLDAFLLQQPDVEKRRHMWEFVRPFIKFANPQFPSTIESPGIILPHR